MIERLTKLLTENPDVAERFYKPSVHEREMGINYWLFQVLKAIPDDTDYFASALTRVCVAVRCDVRIWLNAELDDDEIGDAALFAKIDHFNIALKFRPDDWRGMLQALWLAVFELAVEKCEICAGTGYHTSFCATCDGTGRKHPRLLDALMGDKEADDD